MLVTLRLKQQYATRNAPAAGHQVTDTSKPLHMQRHIKKSNTVTLMSCILYKKNCYFVCWNVVNFNMMTVFIRCHEIFASNVCSDLCAFYKLQLGNYRFG
jgi:hypothetical protein